MLRLSKLTDYAIVVLTYCARAGDGVVTARALADASEIPLPTVSKVLKTLSRAGLLVSHRGVKGGYSVARPPSTISVAEIIEAMEGNFGLTECSREAPSLCEIEGCCPVRSNWQIITATVRGALAQLSLAQMTTPKPQAAELIHLPGRDSADRAKIR